MENQVNLQLRGNKRFTLSSSRYSNKQLRLAQLRHFILYIGVKPIQEGSLLIILLYDSHSSYTLIAFKELALEHNIFIALFLSYITHVIQPLDVAVFQPYKYQHNKAIKKATRYNDGSYSIANFLYHIQGKYALLTGFKISS